MSSASSAPVNQRAPKHADTAIDAEMRSEYDFGRAERGRLSTRFPGVAADRAATRARAELELQRLHGMGSAYARLLCRSGIGSVPQLAGMQVDGLYARLARTNALDAVVRRLPGRCQVEAWVREAKASSTGR
jgi:predicted flap endonuclease-1-like 5' DNA nuclease